MKLIDKAALVAEIERLRINYGCFSEYDMGFSEGRSSAFDEVLSFLNTLEVKEVGVDFGDPQGDIGVKWVQEEPVSDDLEEAAKNHKSAIHIVSPQWTSEVEKAFKAGAEWQKEQMLKEDKS